METVAAAFNVADWRTTLSDTMIESIQKAGAKNYPDMTVEDVRACCPLVDWLDELNAQKTECGALRPRKAPVPRVPRTARVGRPRSRMRPGSPRC